jgi:hypothetical protein
MRKAPASTRSTASAPVTGSRDPSWLGAAMADVIGVDHSQSRSGAPPRDVLRRARLVLAVTIAQPVGGALDFSEGAYNSRVAWPTNSDVRRGI